jgi:predicted transcriptional regulator
MNKILTPQEIETQAAKLGWSVVELCSRADIAPSTFYRWRSGDTKPTLEVYQRLIDALATVVP